jgi:DNA-binding NarL/FixJ family response regulator
MTIRVLVADDQPLISAGIGFILNAAPDIDVVTQAATGDLVDAAPEHRADVFVMDVPADGVDIIGKVTACGEVRLLVFTAQHTWLVCDALLAGAAGYLLKATSDALVGVVRAVARTGTWLGTATINDLLGELRNKPVSGHAAGLPDRLTPREQEILVLMAWGPSGAEIADRLYLSTLTIRAHVGGVLTKLGARNRTHAVATAYRTGLVRIRPPPDTAFGVPLRRYADPHITICGRRRPQRNRE